MVREASGYVIEGRDNLVRGLSLDVTPAFARDAARARAVTEVRRRAAGPWKPRFVKDGVLALVSPGGSRDAHAWQLAWRYDILANPDVASYSVDVDAKTGRVLRVHEEAEYGGITILPPLLQPSNVPVTAKTVFDGPQMFTATEYQGGPPYWLSTSYANGSTPLPPFYGGEPALPSMLTQCQTTAGLFSFSSPGAGTNGQSVFASSDINLADPPCDGSAGAESLWGAQQVDWYWWKTLGWTGINNDPQSVNPSTGVHLRLIDDYTLRDNSKFENDTWTVRLGANEQPSPLPATYAALEIIGHEMTHGMEYSLLTTEGECTETQAVFEGVADALGISVKNSLRTTPTWLIGAQVESPPIRNMQAPKLGGSADAYLGANYIAPSCGYDYYVDGTVLDYWFYLINIGGSGYIDENDSDPSEAYKVTPLATTPAEAATIAAQIVFNGLKGSPAAPTFFAFADATEKAAQNISAAAYATVANAWRAVGIGDGAAGALWHSPQTGETDVNPWPVPLASRFRSSANRRTNGTSSRTDRRIRRSRLPPIPSRTRPPASRASSRRRRPPRRARRPTTATRGTTPSTSCRPGARAIRSTSIRATKASKAPARRRARASRSTFPPPCSRSSEIPRTPRRR